MIILDTNVISEIMRTAPDPAVLDWLRARPVIDMATTTINTAEIRYGFARLPFGARRSALDAKFHGFVVRGFENRVFDFDGLAAEAYGDLVVMRERAGRRLEGFDGLIAAIALSRGLDVATRNVDDFQGCGVTVESPWDVVSG